MDQLIERNYKSIVKRGLINDETKFSDFILKLDEEVYEFKEAYLFNDDYWIEAADIILVIFNMARHYNINIQDILKEKIIINENRHD